MPFNPFVNDMFIIDGAQYRVAEDPAARMKPLMQTGRTAAVYQLFNVNKRSECYALKVFEPPHRLPSRMAVAERLAAFAELPGLAACKRTVFAPERYAQFVRAYPDLTYGMLMPWIAGPRWEETVTARRDLGPALSLQLARALAEVLDGMERRGLAHCGLSGRNVLLPSLAPEGASSVVGLVDMEQFFGPNIEPPAMPLAGAPGYSPRAISADAWGPLGDRFAGAVLIAEMLGLGDTAVRDAAWGASYFDPNGIQADHPRYFTLLNALRSRWGEASARLFERAWHSATLAECPSFAEWLNALPRSVPSAAALPQAEDPTVRRLVDLAMRMEEQGNKQGALAMYQQAVGLLPAGHPLKAALTTRIEPLRATMGPTPTPAPAPAQPFTAAHAPTPTQAQPSGGAGYALPTAPAEAPSPLIDGGLARGEWRPAMPAYNRTKTLLTFVGVFAVLGCLVLIIAFLGGDVLQDIYQNVRNTFGSLGVSIANAAGMALLVGVVQAWVFRARLHGFHRVLFVLATIVGGAIGGGVGYLSGINSSLLGGIIGVFGGAAASLAQNFLMRNRAAQIKWLLFSAVSWGLIWLIGWTISYAFGAGLGVALSAAFMMLATGLSLAFFLGLSPEVEF
jgi:hypothetical protein